MFITASELTASPGKSGHLRPLVAQMRDVLGNSSGKDWWAWAVVTGRPYGSFVLSTRFDDYADMIAAQMKTAASSDWAALAASAEGVLAQPAPTILTEVIAVTGEPSAPKQFAIVTRAVIDRSALVDAISWSTRVAEHVTKVTGVSATVATSAANDTKPTGPLLYVADALSRARVCVPSFPQPSQSHRSMTASAAESVSSNLVDRRIVVSWGCPSSVA